MQFKQRVWSSGEKSWRLFVLQKGQVSSHDTLSREWNTCSIHCRIALITCSWIETLALLSFYPMSRFSIFSFPLIFSVSSLKSHPLCPNPKGQGQLKIAKHFSWNTTRIKMTVTLCITQIGFWRVVRCSYEIAYICEVCTFHLWYYFENLPMKSANSGNDDDIMILQTYWNQYHRPMQTPRSGYTEPPPTEGPTPGPDAEWVSWDVDALDKADSLVK